MPYLTIPGHRTVLRCKQQLVTRSHQQGICTCMSEHIQSTSQQGQHSSTHGNKYRGQAAGCGHAATNLGVAHRNSTLQHLLIKIHWTLEHGQHVGHQPHTCTHVFEIRKPQLQAGHAGNTCRAFCTSAGHIEHGPLINRVNQLVASARTSMGRTTPTAGIPSRVVEVPQQPAASCMCGYTTAFNWSTMLKIPASDALYASPHLAINKWSMQQWTVSACTAADLHAR